VGKKDVCPVCNEKVDLRHLYADHPWETQNLSWWVLGVCVGGLGCGVWGGVGAGGALWQGGRWGRGGVGGCVRGGAALSSVGYGCVLHNHVKIQLAPPALTLS